MRRRAFTLIEVLVVIVLLALLAAFMFPDLQGDMRRRSLAESCDRLRSLINMTHARAMQDGMRYRIQFPGTPDPNDPQARKDMDVPLETQQPEMQRQADPLGNPDAYEGFDASWRPAQVLQPGTRCVAVLAGKPNFDISPHSPIAGPQITEGITSMVPLVLNPDGTCDWVTFVITDLPPETEMNEEVAPRILNVIVDGRTGQVWVQRALRVREVELMNERGASPILHTDFLDASEITEDNILEIHMSQSGVSSGGGRPAPSGSGQ